MNLAMFGNRPPMNADAPAGGEMELTGLVEWLVYYVPIQANACEYHLDRWACLVDNATKPGAAGDDPAAV